MINKRIHLKCLVFVMMLFVFLLCCSSCGAPKQVGKWYSIEDPDGDTLTITEDNTYILDDEGGTCSETESGIILVPNYAGYDSKELIFTEYEGAQALEDGDGDIWIKDYDKARSIYEQLQAEEEEALRKEQEEAEAAEEERREYVYSLLQDSLEGTFWLQDSSDYIVFKNGKYTFFCEVDDEWEQQTGSYKLEAVNDEGGGYYRADWYYSIEFVPEKTTDKLKDYLDGKAFISDARLGFYDYAPLYSSAERKIAIMGSCDSDKYYDYDWYVDGGPYFSKKELTDSDLEKIGESF